MTIATPEMDPIEILPLTEPEDDYATGDLTVGQLVIGLDIDDVIYPWFEAAEEVCEAAGLRNGKKATSWAMHDDYGCSKEDWVRAIETAAIWGDLYSRAPIPGAVDALKELVEMGHWIHIVTARGFFKNGDIIRRKTVEWLYDWDIPHVGLTFTRDKAIVDANVYLDDGQHNVERLHSLGRDVFLMDAPHNQNFEFEKRVHSMAEFVEALK